MSSGLSTMSIERKFGDFCRELTGMSE
jgi:hypothetical protein